MRRVFAVLMLAACGTPPPVLTPQVERGPATATRPHRVLLLLPSCGSVESRCPREYVQTVDAIVRGGLEFAGYAVIGSESLLNETRQRHEEHKESTETSESHSSSTEERTLDFDRSNEHHHTSASTSTSSEIVLDGPIFEDLSVTERQEVMQQAGADAIAVVRIVIGGTVGVWAPDQNVEVLVKLGVDNGDSMAWASRCMASSSQFSTVTAALEHAARCSVYGGTGK